MKENKPQAADIGGAPKKNDKGNIPY